MVASKESCPTKTHLLSEWQKATEIYSKAVTHLSRKIGIVPRAEYEKLTHAAETARKHSLDAKAALEAHTKAHGCDNNGEAAA